MIMKPRTLTGLLLLVTAPVLLFGHSAVKGASQTDASVVDRIAALEIQVGSLQERLTKVERNLVPSKTPDEKPLPTGKVTKGAWRSLSKGLTRSSVRSLLGEPDKISGGDFEHWYYGSGGGSVTFYHDVLDSWLEP
jgi:outer membrane protein assembly factor BamE (lipoprotein component of BamABCDE complex)